jgi:hypothetical protein
METKQLDRPKYQTIKLSVTVKGRLEAKYNDAAREKIKAAIELWKNADAKRGIHTVHVAVDDRAEMTNLWRDHFPRKRRVTPLSGKPSALKIKRVVDDLWDRLNPEYLVLFGGDDVIPMFKVENPSHNWKGDWDRKLPTDNPYATSKPFLPSDVDPPYLIPERVVGRIPDMHANGDPAWLVDYLATAIHWKSRSARFYRETYAICSSDSSGPGKEFMQSISKPVSKLFVSPPTRDISTSARRRLSARLHMIRCHGNPLDAAFWGHDPDEENEEKAWKRAITSTTLKARLQPATLVGTMCCYGAQIFSPTLRHARSHRKWPLASTYLRRGALAFVGSTKRAWLGGDRMDSADWLVADYLKRVLGGASIGRAFLESKQKHLGFQLENGQSIDRPDQKTLIEYVLLGDPSIHPVKTVTHPRSSLVAAERRQRRVVLARIAEQVRKLLPTRARLRPAAPAEATKVFKEAFRKSVLKKVDKFRIKPSTARVEELNTRLGQGEIRQSLEYYWTGQRGRGKRKQTCLLRAETDPEHNVCHTTVVYSS